MSCSTISRILIFCLLFLSCSSLGPPKGGSDSDKQSEWELWYSLQLPLEIVADQLQPPRRKELSQAARKIESGHYRSAFQHLQAMSARDSEAAAWLWTLAGNLAAMRLDRCIRGEAFRLSDDPDTPPRALIDWDPNTNIEAQDIRLQALLQHLESSIAHRNPGLQIQAHIARARVLAWIRECPATPAVAQLSDQKLRQDCSALASKQQWPPDVAYICAMLQLEDGTPAQARPLLERAIQGGYRDPAVNYVLSGVLYELKSWSEAKDQAQRAALGFSEQKNNRGQADAWTLAAQSALALGDRKQAQSWLTKARGLNPLHPRALATQLQIQAQPERRFQNARWLAGALQPLWPQIRPASTSATSKLQTETTSEPTTPEPSKSQPSKSEARSTPKSDQALDIFNELAWACAQMGPLETEILQLALTLDLDEEQDPYLRGVRYFWAATLDLQLGDPDQARGRAALAAEEFDSISTPPPFAIEAFLSQLHQQGFDP